MESPSYRSLVVVSQHVSWFLGQLLRLRFSIHSIRPTELFESRTECCLILAANHRSVLDPWLIMGALPYRCVRALIPVRFLAAQTFTDVLWFFLPVIKIIYWLVGV